MPNDNQTAKPSPSCDAACSQYLPTSAIPSEVHEAAETLFVFFEKQGMKQWEFSYVADRRLVGGLERERDAYKRELENIANASMKKWEMNGDEFLSEFQAWAQNRARHALSSANA